MIWWVFVGVLIGLITGFLLVAWYLLGYEVTPREEDTDE